MRFNTRINSLIDKVDCFEDSDEIFTALLSCKKTLESTNNHNDDEIETIAYWLSEAANHIYGQQLWIKSAEMLLKSIVKDREENGNV